MRSIITVIVSLAALLWPIWGMENKYMSMSCENGVCSREEDGGPCVMDDDKRRLFRWEPFEVSCNFLFNDSLFLSPFRWTSDSLIVVLK